VMKNLPYEYLIIDDGSTDESVNQISDLLGGEVRCVNQTNSGQAKAVNVGLNLARGKYGIVVNSDDPLFSEELARVSIELLEENPDLVATYPDWQVINSTGQIIRKRRVKEFSIEEMVGNFNCLIGPGGVFRIREARAIGGWSSAFRFVPDFDFWLRLSDHGKFKRIPRALAQWRSHSKSISIASRGLPMSLERLEVIEKYLESHDLDSRLQRRARASANYSAATMSLFDSRVRGGRLLRKAIESDWSILFRRNPLRTLGISINPISRPLFKIILRLGIKSASN
jgi:glycosyltransferase involved in cell wall biosynthesis